MGLGEQVVLGEFEVEEAVALVEAEVVGAVLLSLSVHNGTARVGRG